ncbi:maleylpyruvate isomerase family mycothiol-dependent enzyme [Streptomyces tsukubensis]|uniref:Maleylpyruvate isomerase family mycothiol-dependent enzyme n=1 Tax=Streptomyces tsukubensis TaxID=83656 RepID=A0A1V4A5N3_9ACTN|nr:maleylpyruvate isomerase family mycothiol-dependent enzyme [Streptomyces tsukubensis]OON75616.1 hypothetical protein B1H18_22425 [Streptomyces tsukubensis]QFR94401.1 maleylpyruvate isomerase family mycothiol-dependent enzyme [Streptomyces tsukubensis]
MPLVRKRTRSYDPAKIRAAVLAQFGQVREAVRTLTPQQLDAPSGLGDWAVRDLAVHLALALNAVVRGVELPEPFAREVALQDWPFATERYAEDIARDARSLSGTVSRETSGSPEPAVGAEELDLLFESIAGAAAALLPAAPDERLIATRTGAMTLADYMVTRCVELVVHTDDLNRATGLDVPLDRQALAACTRLLADALATKAPGAATEVRVPPYAVVQCIEGPRHTRGTPPNVVETDPLTWIRLATGRTDWSTALDEARVSASGERADLSAELPILG